MAVESNKFLQVYANLLYQTWGDDALKQRFLKAPADVLKEFGLDPGGSKVNVTVIDPSAATDFDKYTPEGAATLWNEGLTSGQIDFVYLPELPEGAEGMELSVEQMEAISGGGCCCCCTCTPSCSCS